MKSAMGGGGAASKAAAPSVGIAYSCTATGTSEKARFT